MAKIQKYKVKSGWRWRVRWVDADGNQKSQSFDRQKLAADFLISLEHSMREGTYIAPSDITVKQLLNDWIAVHGLKIEYNTRKAYNLNIKHISAAIGNIRLQELRPSDIEKMYAESKLSGKSLQEIHSTLNLAMRHAIKNGLINRNPCDAVDRPKKQKFEASFIKPDMVSEYLKLFEDAWIYPAVVLAIFCGLRRGELLALKWSDINFKTLKINVTHSAVCIDNQLELKKPKNNKARVVDMPPAVAVVLKKAKKKQMENKMLLQNLYYDSEFVIREDNGKRPMPSYVSRFFNRRIKASGLPHVRFHDLRHTTGSLMLLEGVGIKTVSEILGHSSITITADIYAHVIDEQKKEAAMKIGKYLN
jgi:integrase